jgi:hypothetical protein
MATAGASIASAVKAAEAITAAAALLPTVDIMPAEGQSGAVEYAAAEPALMGAAPMQRQRVVLQHRVAAVAAVDMLRVTAVDTQVAEVTPVAVVVMMVAAAITKE